MKQKEQQSVYLTHDDQKAVLNCLHDLTAIEGEREAPSLSGDETYTLRILTRLLALCTTHQGMVVCSLAPDEIDEQESNSALSTTPQVLVAYGLQAEEIASLKSAALLTSEVQYGESATKSWLSLPFPLGFPNQVWLVMEWILPATEAHTLLARTRRLLPFVQDLAGTLLRQAFQQEQSRKVLAPRERVHSFQNSSEQVGEIFAMFSHEFRTPLTTIQGYTETLQRSLPRLSPEEIQEFLRAIQQAGQRLKVITQRLLDVVQLEAGALSLDFHELDLPSVVRQAIQIVHQEVPSTECEKTPFHVQIIDACGQPTQDVPPIQGHAPSIRNVIKHLLENAIRFSPGGGPIDILVRPALPPLPSARAQSAQTPVRLPPYVEVCISDKGIGIPQEHLSHVFEHFYRVDTSLTREVYGLGVGLTICYYLVMLHQGYIWAESGPDRGSTFHIWLPLSEATVVCHSAREAQARESTVQR